MAWVVGIGLFLLLLFAFPKQVGVLIGLVCLIAAGIGLYIYLQNEMAARERAKISAFASVYPSCSDPNFPLLIDFTNNSKKRVMKIFFDIRGYREGFSDAIAGDYSRSSDRIIEPGASYTSCWTYPNTYGRQIDFTGLKWTVEVNTVRFE